MVVARIDDAARQVTLILNHSNPLEVIYQTYVIQEHLSRVVDVRSTAPKTCVECAKEKLPCHHPAVDASLPVVLSDRVPQIVSLVFLCCAGIALDPLGGWSRKRGD